MNVSLKHIAVIAAAAVLATAGTSRADKLLKSGDTAGGWKIIFPAGITLTQDFTAGVDPVGTTHLQLEKDAQFFSSTLPLSGLPIVFTQVSATASPLITIADERLSNLSNTFGPGATWGEFDFIIADNGNANPATFSSFFTAFDHFTTVDHVGPQEIHLTGGVVPPLDTVLLGQDGPQGLGGDLVIDAHPDAIAKGKTFTLLEKPVAVGVPLPTAAWSGLTGLVGLGLLGSAKKVKKILA